MKAGDGLTHKDLAYVERDFRTLKSGQVLCRRLPEPSPLQKQLLDALKLTLPATVPETKVRAVTRKKINKVRKSRVK